MDLERCEVGDPDQGIEVVAEDEMNVPFRQFPTRRVKISTKSGVPCRCILLKNPSPPTPSGKRCMVTGRLRRNGRRNGAIRI